MVLTEILNGKKTICWSKHGSSAPDLSIVFNRKGQLDRIRINFEEKIDKTIFLESLPQIKTFLRDDEVQEVHHGEYAHASIVIEPEYGGVTIFNFHHDPVIPNITDNQALLAHLGEVLAIPVADMARLRGRVRVADRSGNSLG